MEFVLNNLTTILTSIITFLVLLIILLSLRVFWCWYLRIPSISAQMEAYHDEVVSLKNRENTEMVRINTKIDAILNALGEFGAVRKMQSWGGDDLK